MRLVEHMRRIETLGLTHFRVRQFVEYQKQAVRIDGSRIQIIVAIFAVVEMKPTKFAELDQPRHDHLDIHRWRMMPKIDQTIRLIAQFFGDHVIRTPVLHHG